MEVKVNEQPQRFYLACEKWELAFGHEIQVGKYRFCAIPVKEGINITEVTSGAKVLSIPMTIEIWISTATKEETMQFLKIVGGRLKHIVESKKGFDEQLEKIKKTTLARLGEMPPIEDVDVDMIVSESDGVLH